MLRTVLAFIIALTAAGCVAVAPSPPLTQLQLRQLQSRSYPNRDMITSMRAVINALLDEGFIIKNADKDLGFIQASKEESLGSNGFVGWGAAFAGERPRWRNSSTLDCSGTLTATGDTINVRLIFQSRVLDNFGVPMSVDVVIDPTFYQNVFTKIDKSLFLEREKLVGR